MNYLHGGVNWLNGYLGGGLFFAPSAAGAGRYRDDRRLESPAGHGGKEEAEEGP